ncbi:KGK domain-containing protein [Anabaena azotica]|uniref:KGK domain-containing protein n=1 Tax=Anabaena azotica TaxID=197653 RepID=UPI0039A72EF0
MNKKHISLNCDDDILSFQKDIFKINRLRELLIREIREKLMQPICNPQQQAQGAIIKSLKDIKISEEMIEINSIKFEFFKDCLLLRIGSKNWQNGKLKVQISISPQGKHTDEVYMEFYPDNLDELLPLENLQHISKNMNYSELY